MERATIFGKFSKSRSELSGHPVDEKILVPPKCHTTLVRINRIVRRVFETVFTEIPEFRKWQNESYYLSRTKETRIKEKIVKNVKLHSSITFN